VRVVPRHDSRAPRFADVVTEQWRGMQQTTSPTASDPAEPCLTDGICELTLEAEDLNCLERFYGETFGLGVISRQPDRVWLACGSAARLGIWLPGKKEFGDEGGRHVHFALSAAPGALDAIKRRLDERGVAHRGPVDHEGGDRSIYVQDPEGNLVEIWDFFQHSDGARDGVAALS
jgi:catechol 2,3-dioxygenase-like lactoylglutathione lyase family enzyme